MDLSHLKNKPKETPPEVEVETPEEEPKVEKLFQTYRSGLENQKIIMKCGRTIYVRQHKYITNKQDEIDFLDDEILLGFPGLKKGEPVTETDLDPMAALRKRIAAEEREKIMKEIDAGTSKTQKVIPASTDDLGALAGNSNSSDAPAS